MKAVVFTLLIAVVVLAVASGLQFNNNDNRVTDINRARVASCEQTYEGVRQVFQPFFQPAKQRTPKENRDINKFNDRVDSLKRGCVKQTKP